MTAPLQPVGEAIYTLEGDPLRMLGIPFGTRMTVVRLADGTLWLHSPITPTPQRVATVQTLGPVAHLIAPSTFHHLHVDTWSKHAPEAKIWATPGLTERYSERRFDAELADEPPPEWADEIDQLVFRGSSVMLEVVFFHRPSRTLIITDIVQNHEPDADGWFWRTVKRINGISAPDGGVPRDWRLSVRDKAAARDCRDRMLAWPFDRVLVTHGSSYTERAHERMVEAFAWLD